MKKPRATRIQDDPSHIKPKSPEPRVVEIRHKHEEMGGSRWKEFNHVLLKQVMGSLWVAHAADKEAEIELFDAAAAALAGMPVVGLQAVSGIRSTLRTVAPPLWLSALFRRAP
jgi:hypothetical protein